jgi:hypothetical protein
MDGGDLAGRVAESALALGVGHGEMGDAGTTTERQGMIDATSIEQVARAALIEAYNCGQQRRECGGVIYYDGKRYTYTVPVSSNKPFGVEVPALAQEPPAGLQLVADYHNHICSARNRPFAGLFSEADVLVDAGFKIIGYMLDGCTGNIHRFNPAVDERDNVEVDFVSGRVIYLTTGYISGWIDIFTDYSSLFKHRSSGGANEDLLHHRAIAGIHDSPGR